VSAYVRLKGSIRRCTTLGTGRNRRLDKPNFGFNVIAVRTYERQQFVLRLVDNWLYAV
jgi:hypothetical protein